MAYMAAAGLLMGAGGAFLEGRSNDIMRSRIKKAANLPGVDVDAITGESLAGLEKYLPQASKLSADISAANQAALGAQEEAALPGIGAARQQALGRISSLFQEDSDWLRGVQRRGAALGLSSGLFGSQAGQIQTLRLSDRESMGRTQLGTGLLGSLIGSMRLANSPGVQAFLGPDPNQLVGIRSQERAAKQQLLAGAAQIPGQTAAWGKYLTNVGGMLTGAGALGMMGGGGGGPTGAAPGAAMPSASQYDGMMIDYYGLNG